MTFARHDGSFLLSEVKSVQQGAASEEKSDKRCDDFCVLLTCLDSFTTLDTIPGSHRLYRSREVAHGLVPRFEKAQSHGALVVTR